MRCYRLPDAKAAETCVTSPKRLPCGHYEQVFGIRFDDCERAVQRAAG